jgi:hypothetical protein
MKGTGSLTANGVGTCRQAGGVPMAAAPWIVSDELWSRIELFFAAGGAALSLSGS